jgi:hypothetical protein
LWKPGASVQVLKARFDLLQQVKIAGRTLLRIGQDPGSFRSATVRGDLVRRLVDRAKSEPGGYAVAWDGRHDSGMSAANGIYFYSLRTEHANLTRRMLLLK